MAPMVSDHRQQLRLIEVLRRHKRRLGSFDRLAREISESSGGTMVDRRKLKNLVDGADVSLRVSELRALDAYLAPMGEGLAAKPVFEQSGILAEMARRAAVRFVLGSIPRDRLQRNDISHWDVRSMIEILRDLNHYGRMQVDIEEVIYKSAREMAGADHKDEGWYHQLPRQDRSLVCIGSSRIARATEVVLAEMFEVEPFDAAQPGDRPLPFYFVWPEDRRHFVSRFGLDGASLRKADPQAARAITQGDSNVMALRIGSEALVVRRAGERWLTYGVIAAQRRYNRAAMAGAGRALGARHFSRGPRCQSDCRSRAAGEDGTKLARAVGRG